MQTRPFEAARLYREGYAPRVLVASPASKPTDKMGLTGTDTEVTKRILSNQGVPDSAVVEFGDEVSSTHEEALALGSWIRKTGAKKIIIVSDPFHIRRVRSLFNKELQSAGTEILTRPLRPSNTTLRIGGKPSRARSNFRTRSSNTHTTGSPTEELYSEAITSNHISAAS